LRLGMRATNMPESNHRAAAFASQKYQLHAYKIGVGQTLQILSAF
jgi:hypothetical protein